MRTNEWGRTGGCEKEKRWKNFLDGNLLDGRLPVLVFVPALFLIGQILFLGCIYGMLGGQGLTKGR